MERTEPLPQGTWTLLREGALATCSFELKRNFTVQRLMVAAVLALFPPFMMFLILIAPRLVGAPVNILAVEFLIVVLVAIVCFLSLLLWSSTTVDSDLEGKTWVYLASRPMGRTTNLVGKLFASLLQSLAVCMIAIAGSVLIAALAGVLTGNPLRLCLGLMAVFAVSAFVYNCVLTLLGVFFFRRAMVACVAWGLVSELFVANIPAVVRFVTVRYHLQELLIRWIGWPFPFPDGLQFYRDVFGDFGVWLHLVVLAGIAAVTVGLALWRINHHEYLSAEDG